MEFKHKSVLLEETIEGLNIKPDGIYVDGTLGGAGHAGEVCRKLSAKGRFIGIDQDQDAIIAASERLAPYKQATIIRSNYCYMVPELAARGIHKVNGILLDLGVSSYQLDNEERGFTYRVDAPLDMRMNKDDKLSAYEVINHYSKEELEHVLRDYGEEKYYRSIVSNILKTREEKVIETTFELVEVIKRSLPYKVLNSKGHPAKQTFQAIRIEVNHELDSLKEFLNSFEGKLNKDGRVVIITFHSLEDKLVKYKFKELSTVVDDLRIAKLPSEIETADYTLLSRKAVIASDEELTNNPRSKSAKLRGIKYGKDLQEKKKNK